MASFRDNRMEGDEDDVAVDVVAEPYVLSGTNTHRFVSVPHFMIPQMEAYSFLQMNWLYHIVQASPIWRSSKIGKAFKIVRSSFDLTLLLFATA